MVRPLMVNNGGVAAAPCVVKGVLIPPTTTCEAAGLGMISVPDTVIVLPGDSVWLAITEADALLAWIVCAPIVRAVVSPLSLSRELEGRTGKNHLGGRRDKADRCTRDSDSATGSQSLIGDNML